MCGDIGCFGLGALPPLRMIDTINHMGMSISMAQGLYEAFHHQAQGKKVVALLGDGTFFHSGLAALVNAVYTRANILVIVFDNRTVGMTGHQSNPGASRMAKYHEMDIAQVVRGLGVGVVENMDPYNIREGMGQLQKAMDHEGVSVLVAKSPCIFLPEYKLGIDRQYQIVVDPKLCNHCANHEDLCLHCSRPYSPISNLRRAKAKLLADISIEGQEQQCPANICNHGFFHSILEGQYKTAVEMVRDKMLFARTCGDICHRPCELFSDREELVPIKALKNFVSSSPQAFTDFSGPISRALKAVPKGYTVGIVGAGPAGLSAAYDLVQMGYEVHLYDREHQPGGMVAFAIPNFRMDKEGLHYESMQLAKMGVQFHFGQEMGKEFELEELRNKYDAVLLALGQGKPRPLAVVETQVPASRRMDALQLLRQLNTGQTATEADGAILVIGGGNSAMDAARAAKRRYPGSAVVVSCLETQDKLPAFPEEFGHALREQVQFIFGSQVHGIQMMANGRLVVGLRDVGSGLALTQMEVGLVVTAIGQVTDTQALGQRRPPLDGQGRVAHHDGQIENGNLFVAGDLAAGNNMSVIGAIGSGKRAANSIRRHFENHGYEYEGQFALDRLNTQQHVYAARPPKPKADVLLKTIERFDLQQACAKCNHCVDNFGCPAMIKENGKVVIDQELCNLCGLCIDVCPNNAISWQVVKTETKPIEKTATPV
jgi:NADPH-dependent glutamate synthase beta subunit-like oxidoreductase/NAD-dependent dihydropyrimidine dehydrogenase PreA subunit